MHIKDCAWQGDILQSLPLVQEQGHAMFAWYGKHTMHVTYKCAQSKSVLLQVLSVSWS